MIRVLQMIGALEMGGSQALVMNLYRHMDRERIQFDFVLDHPDRDDYAAEVKELGAGYIPCPASTATWGRYATAGAASLRSTRSTGYSTPMCAAMPPCICRWQGETA
ncbi:MAG: hypothetical protein V8T45_03730 [Oscillospiraceae bacterium]